MLSCHIAIAIVTSRRYLRECTLIVQCLPSWAEFLRQAPICHVQFSTLSIHAILASLGLGPPPSGVLDAVAGCPIMYTISEYWCESTVPSRTPLLSTPVRWHQFRLSGFLIHLFPNAWVSFSSSIFSIQDSHPHVATCQINGFIGCNVCVVADQLVLPHNIRQFFHDRHPHNQSWFTLLAQFASLLPYFQGIRRIFTCSSFSGPSILQHLLNICHDFVFGR